MIRVLIADDHALVREGLKLVLSRALDMQVTSTAIKGLTLDGAPRLAVWDVLVLDVTVSRNGDAFEILRRIRGVHPSLPVLVISVHSEEECGLRALRAGAAGYIRTSSSPEELVRAIRRVAAHGRYLSAALAEMLAARLDHDEDTPEDILSNREFQVFLRLAAGERPTSIARALRLSIKTISTYRSRILEKLHLETNCHLIHYAIQRDLAFGMAAGNSASTSLYYRKSA
jgi:DNA-binding NarL/FixJ family response regulator